MYPDPVMSFVVVDADVVAGNGEGVPGDVEPTITREQLVCIITFLQELHQSVELLRVFRANIGSLPEQVLRVLHSPNLTIDIGIAKTRIDDDRPRHEASRFQ